MNDVNGWRAIFLVNELAELQTYRLIRTDFTLFVYILLMEGVGLRYWTTHDPDLKIHDTNSPKNYTLYFFVTTLIIYAAGIIQYTAQYAVKHWWPLRTEDFVDLCSISNISILMFDESF